MAKVAATIPENLRPLVIDAGARTPPGWKIPPDGLDVAQARNWIRLGRKIALTYLDAENRKTERVIWPIVVGYHEAVRLLIGWCELRKDFRHFRIDRVAAAAFLEERYPGRPSMLRAKWLASLPKDDAPQKAPAASKCAVDTLCK
ncbi:MAG: WYL domain-containing protein [Xanthobacteraceae bacterium]